METTWRGNLIGMMYSASPRVTRKELADKIGLKKSYITMILNGHRNPPGAEELLTGAFREIMAERGAQ